jgi:hypothetical protein
MDSNELTNPAEGVGITLNDEAANSTAATPETEATIAVAIQPATPAPVALTKSTLADMSAEALDKIVVESMIVNRARLIPALKEMHRLYAHPGLRKPIPGVPTWTEYVKLRIGRSIRTVQYWLEEPDAKIARGLKKGREKKKVLQLDPDPEEFTRWGEKDSDAQAYCLRLAETLTTDEAKRNNPLLPLLKAVAETPGSASLPDMLRAFSRNLVRAFPIEHRRLVAEAHLEAARTELDLLRDELSGLPAATQVPSYPPINAEQAVDDGAPDSEDKQPYTDVLVGSVVLPLSRAPEGIDAPAKHRRRKLLLDDEEDVFDSVLPKPVAPQRTESSVAAIAV